MTTKSMVRAVVKELVRNVETLSNSKWSGVHCVPDPKNPHKNIYRIHMSDVFARSLDDLIKSREISAMIWDLPRVTFDSPSLWFTIEAKK